MNFDQLLAYFQRHKRGVIISFLIIACLSFSVIGLIEYIHNNDGNAINNMRASSPSRTILSPSDNLIPVTTTPGTPDTSPINSPNNMPGQDLQSQSNSTPDTASPQQAAPSQGSAQLAPSSATTPTTPTPAPTNSGCGVCGVSGGYRKAEIACPMYCVE